MTSDITIGGRRWSRLFQFRQAVRDLVVNGLLASTLIPSTHRWRLLRFARVRVCRGGINPGVWLGSTSTISIGEGTFVNYRVRIDGSTSIGRDCNIGYEVMFCSSTHELGTPTRRAGRATSAPITVGDGTWIGARAVILPGVTIGDGCIVAAGAVVASNCEANGVYAGVPAKRVKELK